MDQFGNSDHDDLLSWLLLSDQLAFDESGSSSSSSSSSSGPTFSFSPTSSGAIKAAGEDEEEDDDEEDLDESFEGFLETDASASAAAAEDSGSKSKKRPRQRRQAPPEGAKKPKDEIRGLEERVQQLQEENAALQAHVLNVTQRTTEIQRHRAEMEKDMAEKMLSDKSDDQAQLQALVRRYSDIYSDYGQFRQKEVAFHLDNLEKLLVPTLVTKMSLWTLQQERCVLRPCAWLCISMHPPFKINKN